MPIMDLASITYLPDTKSKSKSNFVISFTNDFTLSIEFSDICTVFIDNPPYYGVIYRAILQIIDGKVKVKTYKESKPDSSNLINETAKFLLIVRNTYIGTGGKERLWERKLPCTIWAAK
jgi:hypothetical protein